MHFSKSSFRFQENLMDIILTLSDDLVSQLYRLPNLSEFVSEAIKQALIKQPPVIPPQATEPSKWANIVQRVQNDPIHLAGYSEQLKHDMKEFRENFELRLED
jgi:hypothetical protein